ncbi:hypothetical protein EI427_12310 [Flammeovirga pectinis]|uniref:Uncharacterized protein n=1 Tax=Flammeovirga pectinis TaxID=2494373 RepID=A0A3S9P459_9BACT|nr:hypothetical protein [Flammeovirga pectinis]AZQ62995.1 hypothetical protein EI427_12310 [Flammeovirga pectinis]
MSRSNYKYSFLILILLYQIPSLAQTGRYWSNSFNTDASLLSGAVVGGGSGIAAIFYNPAQVADIDYQKFSITANIFSTYIYNYSDALGSGNSYSDWNFKVQPRFVAFLLRPKNWDKTSIELASFTRDNANTELRSRTTHQLDILSATPGIDEYIGDFYYRLDYEDYWLGASIAKKMSDKFSLGISAFHSYVSMNYTYDIEANAYNLNQSKQIDNEDFYVANFKNTQSIKGYTSRIILKIGLKYSLKNLDLGLAVTTPTMAYAGESEIYREVAVNNVSVNSTTPLPNMLVTEFQDELVTNFKEPFSVAVGGTYYREKSSFYFTAEYFAAIKKYNQITDRPPGPEVTNNLIGIRTENWLNNTTSKDQVTNVAIGWRNRVSKNVEIISGFRTDFTYDEYDGGSDNLYPSEITIFSLDQYHVTAGAQFRVLKTDIIAGLQYSISYKDNLPQIANFDNPIEFSAKDRVVLQGYRNNTMSINENTLSLFLGFTYNIGEDN